MKIKIEMTESEMVAVQTATSQYCDVVETVVRLFVPGDDVSGDVQTALAPLQEALDSGTIEIPEETVIAVAEQYSAALSLIQRLMPLVEQAIPVISPLVGEAYQVVQTWQKEQAKAAPAPLRAVQVVR